MNATRGISAEVRTAEWFLKAINDGLVGLPDFQRRFQWGVSDVRSFLSTVLAGFPSGTLLVADNANLNISLRPLEGAPDLQRFTDSLVLLDGQQRLTALYQAMHETGPERYAVDFSALAEGSDVLEDNVVVSFPAYRTSTEIRGAAEQGRILVPFSALASPSSFFAWLNHNEYVGASHSLDESLGETFAQRIRAVHEYQIPVTRIGGDFDVSTVAVVFERLNKTGQRLDVFDLLVARLQGGGWNLRHAWEEAINSFPEIGRVLGTNGLAVVSALSLHDQLDIRRSTVLALPPDRVAGRWEDLTLAASEVASLFLQLGVRQPELLPHDAIATVAIACRLDGVPLEVLTSFFWRASVSRRYEVASSTRARADFRAISAGQRVYDIIAWEPDIEAIMRNTRRSSRALWATIIALLLSGNPLDLNAGAVLSSPSTEEEDIWQLAPFSRGGVLSESEEKIPVRLRTAAQVLVPRRGRFRTPTLELRKLVARRLTNPELPEIVPDIDVCLSSQLLPSADTILNTDDPYEMLELRAAAILNSLRTRANVD